MSDRPPEHDDERLLAELRQLANDLDPVPDEVTGFAKAALGWQRLDSDLAELLSDSLVDDEVATRSGAGVRAVTFRSLDLTLDLEIHPGEGAFVLFGQFAPATAATIDVQGGDGAVAATGTADTLGRFRIELAIANRVRLLIQREPPERPVVTSWIDL